MAPTGKLGTPSQIGGLTVILDACTSGFPRTAGYGLLLSYVRSMVQSFRRAGALSVENVRLFVFVMYGFEYFGSGPMSYSQMRQGHGDAVLVPHVSALVRSGGPKRETIESALMPTLSASTRSAVKSACLTD